MQDYIAADGREFLEFLDKNVWMPREVAPGERWRTLNLEEVLTMLRQWRYRPKPNGGRESNPYSPLNHKKNDRLQRQLLGCVYNSVFVGKSGKDARDYNRLLRLVDNEFDHVTWASFNWDALLEQAFFWEFYRENRFPRCHPDLNGWGGEDPKHLLLKLHGSVTWFYDTSGNVFYVPYGKTKGRDEVALHWEAYLRSDKDAPRPMIAEPSYFKHEDLAERPFLLNHWSFFDRAIAEADIVIVVGYSMPDGDAMAKQTLLTAVARKAIDRFVVVDPDGVSRTDRSKPESGVLHRYRRILGGPRLTEYRCFFDEFLDDNPSLLPLV